MSRTVSISSTPLPTITSSRTQSNSPSKTSSITNSATKTIFIDCNGTVNGNSVIDDCGICGGNNEDKDDCGICFGTNNCLLVEPGIIDWTSECTRFTFTEPTNRANMVKTDYDCSKIIQFNSLQKLGDGAYCYWESNCNLQVCQGKGANILPGDSIIFLPYIKSLITGDVIQSPISPLLPSEPVPHPVSVLQGPSSVSKCENIVLDASYSKSVIGRDLQYQWIYTNPEDNLNQSEIAEILSSLIDNSPIVYLDTTSFDSSISYKFQVEVTNFMGQKDISDEIIITVLDNPLPRVSIIGLEEVASFDISQELSLSSLITIPSCFTFTRDSSYPLYKWQVISRESGLMLHTHQDMNSPTLILTGNTLHEDTIFDIILYVMIDELTISTITTIQTISSPICAKIALGSRTIPFGEDIILDGTLTEDPMNENIPFQWEWVCWQEINLDNQCEQSQIIPCTKRNGEPFPALPNDDIIIIPSDWIQNSSIYYFQLTASKNSRFGVDSVEIIISSTSNWHAWINVS